MTKTTIEWAQEVWNPITGCTKVSQGCKNCYAERIAQRFWGERKFGDVKIHPERLEDPLHWEKSRRVFVNSMSDLFHPEVRNEFIDEVFAIMAYAKQHIFMILTKRPERMKYYLHRRKPLPNVWLGVSVEDQETAEYRVSFLNQCPAAIHFVSIEPMLKPVKLYDDGFMQEYLSRGIPLPKPVDWVICGCESGAGRRPMEIDWARDLRDQCVAAQVPFFLKQMQVDGKIKKMPDLDGRVWDQYPEVGK
jgi:protein gp37